MQNLDALSLVILALVVALAIVLVGLVIWWILASRARRTHVAPPHDRWAPPAGPTTAAAPTPPREGRPTPFLPEAGANDTIPVVPLSDIDSEYERLAAEPFQAPDRPPFGTPAPTVPFSWADAVREVPSPPMPPVPQAPPAAVSAPESAPTSGAPAFTADEQTVIVRREPSIGWHLVLPDGEFIPLAPDTVLGRKPDVPPGARGVTIHDPTRTLSKTHARLRLDGDVWVIEDLHSTNGIALIHEDGREQELEAGVPTIATRMLMLGTLAVELRRDSE